MLYDVDLSIVKALIMITHCTSHMSNKQLLIELITHHGWGGGDKLSGAQQ